MTDRDDFYQKLETLDQLLKAKLGLRGTGLQSHLRRAGRRLPKRIHKAGAILGDAELKIDTPNLAKTLDSDAIDRAFTQITDYLSKIDPRDRRIKTVLGMLGVQVFNLLVFTALIIAVLIWRGII